MGRSRFSLLAGVAYAATIDALMRLIGFLLEVPSSPFGFKEGGKVLAGWVLLLALQAWHCVRRLRAAVANASGYSEESGTLSVIAII